MRIADDGAGDLINIAKQKICRLAPYAGKGQKLFHCAGHPAAEFFPQRLTGEDNIARLVLIKPAGADVFLDLRDIRVGKCIERREAGE